MSFSHIRFDPHSMAEIFGGLANVSYILIRQPQIIIGFGILRFELKGPLEVGDRIVELFF